MASPVIAPLLQVAPRLAATIHDSGFPQSALTYNALSVASDGLVYYALTSDAPDVGARMFRIDPKTQKIERLADITEVCGEAGSNTVVQGKVHVNFHEMDGKLYFATHLGYYQSIGGREYPGIPPAGRGPYPGGHILSYELATGKFEVVASAPPIASALSPNFAGMEGEGIIAIEIDGKRKLIYGLLWPTGRMFRCDVTTGAVTDLGPTSQEGEAGDPPYYRMLCRALALEPVSGYVYISTPDGSIIRSGPQSVGVETVPARSLKRAALGNWDPSTLNELGYAWRQTAFDHSSGVLYAVHGRTGYLFSFEPGKMTVTFKRRITSNATLLSGEFDLADHGYLSFKFGPGGKTLYYLTGAHIDDAAVRAGKENVHLITYDTTTDSYTDHGPVLLDSGVPPSGINSIAVTKDSIYAIAKINEPGKPLRYDLISFPHP